MISNFNWSSQNWATIINSTFRQLHTHFITYKFFVLLQIPLNRLGSSTLWTNWRTWFMQMVANVLYQQIFLILPYNTAKNALNLSAPIATPQIELNASLVTWLFSRNLTGTEDADAYLGRWDLLQNNYVSRALQTVWHAPFQIVLSAKLVIHWLH